MVPCAWKGYGSNYVRLASRELCFSLLYNATHRASDMILKRGEPVKKGWGRVLWQYISGQISDLIDLWAFVVILLHTSICHLPVKDHTAPLTAEVLWHCVRSAFSITLINVHVIQERNTSDEVVGCFMMDRRPRQRCIFAEWGGMGGRREKTRGFVWISVFLLDKNLE